MHKNQEFVQKCWYVNVCVFVPVCPHQACCWMFLCSSLQFWQICCCSAHLIIINTDPPQTPTHIPNVTSPPGFYCYIFQPRSPQPSTSHLLSLSSLCPYSQPTSSSLPTHKNDNKPLWKYLILLDLMDQSLIIRWVRVSFTNDCVHKSFCTSWLRVAHVNVV